MKRTESAKSSTSTSSDDLDRKLNDILESGNAVTVSNGRQWKLGLQDGDGKENVAVMVRCRPIKLETESLANAFQVDETNKAVTIGQRQFFFDQVFGSDCTNEEIYMRSVRYLVNHAFCGYNCAAFLYGQTGTGKTYTHSSLTLSAFEHLFALIQDSNKTMRFLIRASYYELYNEQIYDLLVRAPDKRSSRDSSGSLSARAPKSLELRESKERGVYVNNLSCFLVNNLTELKRLKQVGDKRRTTASTQMNEHSSRSHSIFSITIEAISDKDNSGMETDKCTQTTSGASRAKSGPGRRAPVVRVGRLNLIDLAGSERQSKSGSSGSLLKEASQINLSLTCLSLVIRALTDPVHSKGSRGHIPYRNSKLTRLLSSSLGGNSKTVLIACISPSESNLDETLNTLRFASRTKLIKNKAVINEDPKDALLRKYRRQLIELRTKLLEQERLKSGQHGEAVGGRILDGDDAENGQQRRNGSVDDQATDRVRRQLELLKAKIVHGGENLLDKLELHERLIEESKLELEERRREEAKLREQLQNKRQTIEQVVLSKGSLESQLEYLNEKLARAIALLKSSKLELDDLTSEHKLLKEQLLQTIKSTSKEIKYIDCIVEDFIPMEYLDLINAHAKFDGASNEWQIKYIALSGNNIAQTKRLIASAHSYMTTDETQSLGQSECDNKESGSNNIQVRNTLENKKPMARDSDRPDPYLRLAG